MQAKQPTAKHSHEVEVKRRVQIWVPVLKGNEKMAAAVAQVRLHLQVNMNSERNGTCLAAAGICSQAVTSRTSERPNGKDWPTTRSPYGK